MNGMNNEIPTFPARIKKCSGCEKIMKCIHCNVNKGLREIYREGKPVEYICKNCGRDNDSITYCEDCKIYYDVNEHDTTAIEVIDQLGKDRTVRWVCSECQKKYTYLADQNVFVKVEDE